MRNKKLIILFSVLLSITLLVVFNSALFSVRHVRAYCANVQESSLEQQVLSSHGIKKNANIFFVDKSKVTASVEKIPGLRVLNIEKKFPDRIYINYVEIKEYLKVYSYDGDNAKTYFCSNDLKVMRVCDGFDDESPAIRLKAKGIKNLQAEQSIEFESDSQAAVISEIFSGLERLGYYDTVVDLFAEIDLTGNFIELTTKSLVKWRILGGDELSEKLRFALSIYFSDKFAELRRSETVPGTLIITGKRSATYEKGDGTQVTI